MHRRGLLRPGCMNFGSWRWTWSATDEEAGRVGYRFDENLLHLSYTANGEARTHSIVVARTPCHFGGSRPWFRCPACGCRVAVLYHRQGRFGCRRCQRIAYLSQSDDAMDRAWRKQRKVEARLGPDWAKPKGMHATTYKRLFAVIMDCEEQREIALFARLISMGLLDAAGSLCRDPV
jgi:hypothetical protein